VKQANDGEYGGRRLAAEKATPLFRTLGGGGRKQPTGERLTRQ
jgi:hypothetical protein